ncbi:hypothetical protein EVJ58_g2322 [Rhodofomes roseus]|uniref:Peptidase A1 domain-containing protein n=1 Tax=Rhodofomes roseus TaxID=34475 RepID=A0A4Y9YR88_9APHY|nr:hypothetical protein EVJ58_g2322 [Rhodofomes roseus]
MTLLPLSLLALIGSSYGLSIPFERRSTTARSTTVSVNSNYNGNLGFSNGAGFLYTATIYVQGQPFQVQIDSGRHRNNRFHKLRVWPQLDWMHHDTQTAFDRDGSSATGPIVLANVSFGEFTVGGQAFINAPGSNATTPGFDSGLLGVGPPGASSVFDQLINTTYDGFPFLVNVFAQDPDEPNFMTFFLSRSDAGITQGGVMSIGELIADYVSVLEQPKLPVVSATSWEAFMDGVYVNGKFFTGHSESAFGITAEPGKDQTTIILDTGTSLATAPRYYVDAMYKDVPGSKFNKSIGYYTLPCDTRLNVSMAFGSSKYPMDPIDLTTIQVNSDGSFFCVGTFAPTPDDAGVGGYGSNFTGNGDELPYMQILSITDHDKAWAKFDYANAQRLIQSEYETFAEMYNITATYEAAPQTTTFSLVAPTSGWQTASAVKTHVHSSGGSSATAAPKSSSSSGSSDDKLGSDLAANLDTSSSVSSSGSDDWSALLRNSYIVIGLLGGAILLLLGVLIKLWVGNRNNKYSPVGSTIPPAAFQRLYEPEKDEAFTTPYDDLARPTGSH